tara:strand:+ start:59 stop:1531 length:1473 start_codon:yes stop_codon:yes gene_type:complete
MKINKKVLNILVTGANGYIGMRLIPKLVENGHNVYCAVRNPERLSLNKNLLQKVKILTIDFLNNPKKNSIPKKIDVAYYLIHSMSSKIDGFLKMEIDCAKNFNYLIKRTYAKQIIFLSGIVNNKDLSKHLESRKKVERILRENQIKLTVLRAGIIVGSGSASFEIIRDLCEKLPIMITPKWVKTKSQPIAIRNVIEFLTGVLLHPKCIGKAFDIGGLSILTYKEMLYKYAKNRGLKKIIITVPIMTPRLSSYWLYFVTSTSYPLAVNLVKSMKSEVLVKGDKLHKILGIKLYTYDEAIKMAFIKIEQNSVISSWKDSLVSGLINNELKNYIQVPKFGVLQDKKIEKNIDPEKTLESLWKIGGDTGWYYANFLWKIRGYLDQLSGGVGLRRGRTHSNKIFTGDSLDFWRVLLADKKNMRLLLFAEMKLPGEAWLEFKIEKDSIFQTATFRPKGLWGRAYWYVLIPFHYFIFRGMLRKLSVKKSSLVNGNKF